MTENKSVSSAASTHPLRVDHDGEGHRFVIFALHGDVVAEGEMQMAEGVSPESLANADLIEAGFAEYEQGDGVRDFHHTEVYASFRGRGLSSPLIQAALDDTRAAGQKVIATCSAVAHFISKNPEYNDLLA